MSIADVRQACDRIVAEVSRAIVGKDRFLRNLLACLLAGGHALLEDVPGVAKTLAARTLAKSLGLGFRRIQFTPDLLPADVTGGVVLDPQKREAVFRPGPIFTNLLLGDEINRATPKTQAAMLEAMEERTVTAEGRTYGLEAPFLVIATQNPIEFEGTYPLPEAELDRFLVRLRVGYPEREQEKEILDRRRLRKQDEVEIRPVVTQTEFLAMQQAIEEIHLSDEVEYYIVDLVRATREHRQLEFGASPRAALALWKAARAMAAMEGREYVVPDDAKTMAVPVLSHRIIVRPDLWTDEIKTEDIIAAVVADVPVPGMKEDSPAPAAGELSVAANTAHA